MDLITAPPSASLHDVEQAPASRPGHERLPDETLETLSAWAGEWLGEPEGGCDTLWERPFHAEAVHAALEQWGQGLPRPSSSWQRSFGLLLGLERMSQGDPMRLADGTILAEHQAEVVEAVLEKLLAEHEQPSPVTLADVGARRRCYFEHATGSGKTVTACALVDAARTAPVLILTHRNTLVDQFRRELADRGYGRRLADLDDPQLAKRPNPVVVSTYQTFTRRWDSLDPEMFGLVLCDEVHQSLGERTANAIRAFEDTVFIGMTATGQLLGKEVTDLFPTRVSRFDLRRAAALGVIAPLRVLRVQPAIGLDTLKGVRVKAGDYDADQMAGLLDRDPLNYAAAAFYRDTFNGLPGIVYAAGVKHAEHLAMAFLASGVGAAAVSGQTPRHELERVLRDFESGQLRVLINAQLLVEGWNSPRVTVCLHLAPTASERVYLQRIGRVTRRDPSKEAGIVVDFVPPAYGHDERLITLHSVLDLDGYRTGELVTLPPAGVERPPAPPVKWDPIEQVPVTASPSRRRQWLASHMDQATLSALPFSDRMVWAQEAGVAARTPSDLNVRLRRLESDDPEVWLACAAAALNSGATQDIRDNAFQRLMARRDEATFELLATLAATTERVAWSRRLVPHLLKLAADGVDTDHETLLELARMERTRFRRLAGGWERFRAAAEHGVDDNDRSQTEHLLGLTYDAPAVAAAAMLALVPTRYSWAETGTRRAAEARFPVPANLADALLAGWGRQAGGGDEVVYSSG